MSSSSPHYNHPFWPSPRAARIAKLLLKQHEPPSYLHWEIAEIWREGRPVKPEGRLTHDKALALMADYLGLSVHQFLHIKPVDAILRLKLANTEAHAYRILGNITFPAWWMSGLRMPCCVACERTAPPASTTHVAAASDGVARPIGPPEPSTVVPVRDPPRLGATDPPALSISQLPPQGAAAGACAGGTAVAERQASPAPAVLPALSAAPAPAVPDRLLDRRPIREHPPPGYVLWPERDDPCSCRCLGRTCGCFPIMHDGAGRLWFVTGPGEVWPVGPRDSVACRHPAAAPAPAPAPAAVPAPAAAAELIETLMEFLKEMNGIVTAGDQRYVTALVQRFKGRVL